MQDEQATSPLINSAAAAATLVLPGADWIHRRVQSIRYVDADLVEVSLTIDFTLPASLECVYVPLTVLPKWPPLFRFDYTDANGVSVPLLTSEQNAAADWGLMRALTERVAPKLLEDHYAHQALMTLCTGPDTDLTSAFAGFYDVAINHADELSSHEQIKLDRLIDLAAALTDSTLLWFPRERAKEGRTIAKVRYMTVAASTATWFGRVLRSLSWAQPRDWLPLRHVGADASYHLELEAPTVLVVRDLEPVFFWLRPPQAADESDREASTRDAESAGLRPEENVEIEGRIAHAYIAGRRPLGADLVYRFAPPRNGFVAAAFSTALLVSVFVTLFDIAHSVVSWREHIDGSVALLALVPALIAYVVFRPDDPPLVRRFLLGVQILAGCSALVPLVMAGMLLVHSASGHALQRSWVDCVFGSWVLTLLLAVSLARAGGGRGPTNDVEH